MSFQILQRAYAPYGTAAQFPASGDSRLIYRATDTGYLYTWDASESAYKLAGIDPATVQSDISTLQTDVSAAEGNISTLQGNVATLAQGIVDAVSTHNTATDAHTDIRTLIGGKQAAGDYLLASGTAADAVKLGGVAASAYSFGHGSYTVVHLAAFTDSTRPTVPVYCSDCISPNGTGAMVHWVTGGSAWRLICCGIIATTSWTEYCVDSLTYGISRVQGAKLSCERTFLEGGNVGALSYAGTGAVADITFGNGLALRRFSTGTTATGYAKTAYTQRIARLAPGYRFAIGLVGVSLIDNLTGAFLLFGVSSTTPAASRQTLPSYFVGFALDPGNAAGALNAGLSTNWLTVNRENSVNRTGTGATNVAPELYTGTPQNLLIISDGLTLYFYINSTLVQTASAVTNNNEYIWLQLTNDGTATSAKTSYSKTLMSLVQISQ